MVSIVMQKINNYIGIHYKTRNKYLRDTLYQCHIVVIHLDQIYSIWYKIYINERIIILPSHYSIKIMRFEATIKNTNIKYVWCNVRHISQLIKHPFLLLLPINNLLNILAAAFHPLIFTNSFFFWYPVAKSVDILNSFAKHCIP